MAPRCQPTAAAVAYGYGRSAENASGDGGWWDTVRDSLGWPSAPAALADRDGDLLLCVFDLGGGTCDVSLLACGDGVFEVLSTAGDSQLGGDDFDQRLVDALLADLGEAHGDGAATAVRNDPVAMARLVEAAEAAKVALSDDLETHVRVPGLVNGEDLDVALERDRLNAICAPLVARCVRVLAEAFKDAETAEMMPVTPAAIDGVILVGGATAMPIVRSAVAGFFDGKPGSLGDASADVFARARVDPDEAVALGAAIQAASLVGYGSVDRRDVIVLDDQASVEDMQLLAAKVDDSLQRHGLGGDLGALGDL